ncbi:MAG: FecCD family ABC transporter permease [Erysipelotrichaceae bacterium]
MWKKHWKLVLVGFTILLLVCVLASLHTGSNSLTTQQIIQTLFGQGSNAQTITIFQLRLPRIALALLVGGALALAGSVLQSVTRNDLADTGILGINAGAVFFVVVFLTIANGNVYAGISTTSIWAMPVVALIGAVLSGVAVYALSWKRGLNIQRFLLIGLGMNIGLSAVTTIYQLRFSTQEFNRVMAWSMGSIWGTNWTYVWAILPLLLLAGGYVYFHNRTLDVLSLGDDVATGLGVGVETQRRKLLFAAMVLAGVATSVAGNIAFLGLLSPHIAKKLVGSQHKRVLPIAMLVGMVLLVASDMVARTIIAPMELPVGIIISLLGVPYFIWLLLKG